jgi:hypothetical protein
VGAGPGRLRKRARSEARGPKRRRKHFSFYFSTKQPKKFFLSKKNSFLGHDPKTKVVQNFILYNIALGYILKFQLDFEIRI